MKFKKFINPTLWNIVVTIIIFIIWIFLIRFFDPLVYCKCASVGFENCVDYHDYLIYNGFNCHCNCTSLSELVTNYFWYGLIPLILSYLISCGIFYSVKKHKK